MEMFGVTTPLEVIHIFAAFFGFFIAWYIFNKKRSHQSLVCPLKQKCETVIHSEFSKFLGIPVEQLGIAYYLVIGISYGALLAFPALGLAWIQLSLIVLSAAAFLFSLYLTFIQVFTLKELCTWCLISALLCAGIFSVSVINLNETFMSLLDSARSFIMLVHLIGVAVGLGAATITDVFFFRFLKDFKISSFESDIMNVLSQIIWTALAVIVLSGLAVYMPSMDMYNEAPKFLAKMIIVGVIIANGLVLNLVISPRLSRLSFLERQQGAARKFRQAAFALGSISFTSWYAALLLGTLRQVSLPLSTLLLIYLAVLAGAVIVSQLTERNFAKQAEQVVG